MADVKEIFEKVASAADAQIQLLIEDRKLLRSLFLEEAEKQNEKSKEKITKLLDRRGPVRGEETDSSLKGERQKRGRQLKRKGTRKTMEPPHMTRMLCGAVLKCCG